MNLKILLIPNTVLIRYWYKTFLGEYTVNLSILVPFTVLSVLAISLLLLAKMVFLPNKEKLGDEVMRGDKIMPE